MRRALLIALLVALPLPAWQSDTDALLDALSNAVATFARSAPGLTAFETLHQKGRRGFMEILTGDTEDIRDFSIHLPKDFRTHEVLSSYGIGAIGDTRAIHELRRVIKVDQHIVVGDPEQARHAMTLGVTSADDKTKRQLLENFERKRLEGAVTDFGQLLLLFSASRQNNYDFAAAGPRTLNNTAFLALSFRQVSGTDGVTIFQERTQKRQPISGEIWLRESDLLPLRIVLHSEEVLSKRYLMRNEATIDYQPTPYGLAPATILHQTFLNGDLLVENQFSYEDFRHSHGIVP